MYRSISPVNFRKRSNYSRVELIQSREPKLAKISYLVQCHMSYNELPESDGLQGLDYAQYLSSDFTYPVNPQLDLKLVLERVVEL